MTKSTNVLFLGFSLLALSSSLTACSIKATSPGSDESIFGSASKFADPKPSIAGPAVTGLFRSDCVPGRYETGSRIVSASFTGENITRTENDFSDATCSTPSTNVIDHGIFRYIQSYTDGGYTVEYRFEFAGGYSTFPQEKLWLDTDTLYVSDFVIGDTITKEMSIKLERVGSAPTPQPTPAPAPGACVQIGGQWQMNSDNFTITQNGCASITWTSYDGSSDVYVADHVERAISPSQGYQRFMQTYFNQEGWIQEIRFVDASGKSDQRRNVFSLQKTPCNLANPDGRDYLTMNVFWNGQENVDKCAFWASQNAPALSQMVAP